MATRATAVLAISPSLYSAPLSDVNINTVLGYCLMAFQMLYESCDVVIHSLNHALIAMRLGLFTQRGPLIFVGV